MLTIKIYIQSTKNPIQSFALFTVKSSSKFNFLIIVLQIVIPAQQVLFDKAKLAISVTGGGGRSGDLGIDDFQMVTGACPQPNTEICSKSGQYTINGFFLLHVLKCKV